MLHATVRHRNEFVYAARRCSGRAAPVMICRSSQLVVIHHRIFYPPAQGGRRLPLIADFGNLSLIYRAALPANSCVRDSQFKKIGGYSLPLYPFNVFDPCLIQPDGHCCDAHSWQPCFAERRSISLPCIHAPTFTRTNSSRFDLLSRLQKKREAPLRTPPSSLNVV